MPSLSKMFSWLVFLPLVPDGIKESAAPVGGDRRLAGVILLLVLEQVEEVAYPLADSDKNLTTDLNTDADYTFKNEIILARGGSGSRGGNGGGNCGQGGSPPTNTHACNKLFSIPYIFIFSLILLPVDVKLQRSVNTFKLLNNILKIIQIFI